MRITRQIALTTLLLALAAPAAFAQQQPSREPPLWLDFDMEDIPEPREIKNSRHYDFLDGTLFQQFKQAFDFRRYNGVRAALNVNSVDGVPDSSWFTNRNGRRRMSLEEIRRGPNTGTGPATAGPWTIISGKFSGLSAGFTIRDGAGQVFILKFDPPGWPEMASGAEVIATKLYYASGYNVPENYLVRFHPDILEVAPEAKFVEASGQRRQMTRADVDQLLENVPRLADGRIRALASKFLPGKPKGPFSYHGLREDDPNDWIPHEHRRELRGLRVVASWLNDNDIRRQNTLDMYVNEGGRRFLRHYLLDFGSALGSDTVVPNRDRVGNEYILDGAEIAKSIFAFGFYKRPWRGQREIVYPSLGYIEADRFAPERWKPNFPIVAFENMTLADAFWGAKIVMSFTDDQIRAAVATAEYSEPAAAAYLTDILIRRRDKIGRYWFERAGGLENFRVRELDNAQLVLEFEDLVTHFGFAAPSERLYRYRILQTANASPWQQIVPSSPPGVVLDLRGIRGDFVVQLQAWDRIGSRWSPAVAVHLGQGAQQWRVLGWVRNPH